ncbi:hypothetical protein E3P96_01300 [Wallemia ichthyophaga]|nr:hypothetical protein E3P96_01300 [Wallemia ichthyophaga]
MPAVVMAIVAFCSSITLIPLSSHCLARVGLRGRDLLKPYKQLVPESLGIVPACVLIVLLFLFTPVFFANHLKTHASNLQPQFPHHKLSTYLSALLSFQTATLLGFLDDLFDIRWRYKLPIPLLASIPMLVVYFAEGGITDVVIPLPLRQLLGRVVHLGPLYYIYMAMLSTFCTNSINILAGINGIEVAQAVVIAGSVAINDLLHLPLSHGFVSHLPQFAAHWSSTALVGPTTQEQAERHLFSLCFMLPLIGASLGLLYHNWYPARVFPGDTYCYFAGMAFAIVAVLGHFSKTLLLFFLPQVINFGLSTPQLFGLMACPRHRVPRYVHGTGVLEPSRAYFDKPPAFYVSVPLRVLSAVGVVQLEVGGNGRITCSTNLTLLNAFLCLFGKMSERQLASVTVVFQVACSVLAFAVRYGLAGIRMRVASRGTRVSRGCASEEKKRTANTATEYVTSRWKFGVSYAMDWVICAALLGLLYIINNVHGYWREFDLNDASIRHSHTEDERVPLWLLGILIGLVPIVAKILLSTQWYRSYTDLHHALLGFLLTAGLTLSTTTAVKVLVGRPRPDLIARCQPRSGASNADVGLATADVCTQTDFELLQDGFRSFPSGHSSTSFALLGYLSFYLAGKMQVFDTKGHTVKSWICWAPWIGAVLIAVSRTMDYRHHATDIIAGGVIGTFFAYVCYRQYYPHLGNAMCHKPHNTRYMYPPIDAATNPTQNPRTLWDFFQTTLMGLLSIIRKQRYKSREMRFLFLGLDNAGKTTIMKRVNGEDITSISPTLGFNIKTFIHRGYTLNVWDVGGQRTLRPYWRNYFEQNDAVVWVVDSSDTLRMDDCRNELFDLLSEDRLAGTTILIFANKVDIHGAMSVDDIRSALQLDSIKSHTWRIQPCSAVTGENLLQGLDWAVGDCSKRLYYSSQPDFTESSGDLTKNTQDTQETPPKLFG